MALRKILLQGLGFKNKAPVPGHSISCHQWIHRASTAGLRLALHVSASQGEDAVVSPTAGWAACPGRHCPHKQRAEGELFPEAGPEKRAERVQRCFRQNSRWLVGLAACAPEKRLMEDLGDRQERPIGDPGMRHKVTGLVEGFQGMLRPCRSLDRLADKQAFFDGWCVFPVKYQTSFCYFSI